MKCTAYEVGFLKEYKYVVTFAYYAGQWIFCNHKERSTWETSGGHIEAGESPEEAARRELYEETGALDFDIEPLCDYWACDEPHETPSITWANGRVFLAVVKELGTLPALEMKQIKLFETVPPRLTYPDITHVIFPYALERIRQTCPCS